jgi:diguanylate cyclase (GGDEF)-like protein/PAS domain S-box-containing protein
MRAATAALAGALVALAAAITWIAVVHRRLIDRLRAEAADERAAKETLAEAQRCAHVGSFWVDLASGTVAWSDEQYRILGYEPGAVNLTVGTMLLHVHPDDVPGFAEVLMDTRLNGVPFAYEYRIATATGEERWIAAAGHPGIGADGIVASIRGTIQDVTERRLAEENVRAGNARLERAQQVAHLGSWEWDVETGRVHWSDENFRIFGLEPGSIEPSLEDFMTRVHPEDQPALEAIVTRMLQGGQFEDAICRVLRPDGEFCTVRVQAEVQRLEGLTRVIGTVLDVTELKRVEAALQADIAERRAAEAALAYQARHDSLTGAANRVALREALDAAADEDIALLIIDLDSFKEINDSLGHEVGDQVLVEIAQRLRNATRSNDTVARVGGDEFAVVLHGVGDEDKATGIARSILAALEQSLLVEGMTLHVGASIGIAILREGAAHGPVLLRQADVAMYRAKREGIGVAIHEASDDHDGASRLALVADLRTAIGNDELSLHFQPKIAVASGHVVGVEALARWDHPRQGPISPGVFIPLAERTGLMLHLTRRVLDEALAQCARWDAMGLTIGMSVNLSPRLLHDPELTTWVDHALRTHGVEGHRLTLEITEGALAEGPVAFEAMTALRRLGVKLSIDDLGTGYSSLVYLKRLPIDELKIDQGFIVDLARDGRDHAIVKTIVELGRSLSLNVVAEGVEDEESLAVLRGLHCPVAQGFHCRRPAPADELTPWLLDRTILVAHN